MRPWLTGTILIACLVSGCAHIGRKITAEYVASAPVPTLVSVKRGGDFALYYDDDRKPEIPVRLHKGEVIGFAQAKDGRMQAVAGEFRMNLSSDVQRAYWKRLNTRDD
jgi:hypothetical protein